MKIKIKRVYDKPAKEDGKRILVDRLWPRGLTKEKAKVDVWLKEIAPTTELRKWFNHDPEKWNEFIKKYKQELYENNEQVAILKEYMKQGMVTLVYGARDEVHHEALVIKEYLAANRGNLRKRNLDKLKFCKMKKVLIALDYNPDAQKIAEAGYALSRALGAHAILLHVTSDATYYSSLNYSAIMGFDGFSNLDVVQTNTVEELKSVAQNYLDKTKQHLGDETIETVLKEGEFDECILQTAKEMGVDIIVLGTHSRKGLSKILMGSVAEQVLHHTTIPLFIIPVKLAEEKDVQPGIPVFILENKN